MKFNQMINQRVIVTTSIVLAMLMASMDTTILNLTMPTIKDELGQLHLYAWSFTAYILASTALMPLAGRLADLFGRKNLFAAGILLFLIGSVLCGSADTMLQLVLYRGVQGVGAGVMMPLVHIIAGDLFSVKNRGKIQALFTSMWMISAIAAPMLGAFLMEVANWRWIFYINIPISLVALGMLIPYKDVYAAKREPIDWLGAILFAMGTISLLMVTVTGQYRVVWAAVGLVLLVFFTLHERQHQAPMIPKKLMKNKTLIWMYINNFIICTALFGVPSYVPLFLQGQGESVLFSGLALISMAVGWMALSINSGKWVLRYGYRSLLLMSNALLIMAATVLLLSQWDMSYVTLFIGLLLLGGAFGLTFTVSIIGAQQLVEPHDKGISTSIQMFVRNTGLAVGISIMGYIINQSIDMKSGIYTIFIYSLIGAGIAMFTAWFIREETAAREVKHM